MPYLKTTLNKIKEQLLALKSGRVYIIALIKRTDLEGKWDIIISADWIDVSNSQDDLISVIKILRQEFAADLDFVSRILLLKKDEYIIIQLAQAIRDYHLPKDYLGEIRVNEKITFSEINLLHVDLEGVDFKAPEVKEPIEKTSEEFQ